MFSGDLPLQPNDNNDTINEVFSAEGVTDVVTDKEVVTEYVYDRKNKNLLVSYTADTFTKCVYGNGLILTDIEDETNYYLYDLRESVVVTTDEVGNVEETYSYSTYGKRTVINGTETELGYCARDGVLTEGNGLVYMRARYYSAELMRFINQDILVVSIASSNSLNRYAYVEGNPTTMIDPFGLCGESVNSNNVFDTGGIFRKPTLAEKAASFLIDKFDDDKIELFIDVLDSTIEAIRKVELITAAVSIAAEVLAKVFETFMLDTVVISAPVLACVPGLGEVIVCTEVATGTTVAVNSLMH